MQQMLKVRTIPKSPSLDPVEVGPSMSRWPLAATVYVSLCIPCLCEIILLVVQTENFSFISKLFCCPK